MPAGARQLDVELSWNGDLGRYRTNDLDLVLKDAAANTNTSGSTPNSPERVSIKDPAAGSWNALVQGFTINGNFDDDRWHNGRRRVRRDEFELRVTIDGVRQVPPRAPKKKN